MKGKRCGLLVLAWLCCPIQSAPTEDRKSPVVFGAALGLLPFLIGFFVALITRKLYTRLRWPPDAPQELRLRFPQSDHATLMNRDLVTKTWKGPAPLWRKKKAEGEGGSRLSGGGGLSSSREMLSFDAMRKKDVVVSVHPIAEVWTIHPKDTCRLAQAWFEEDTRLVKILKTREEKCLAHMEKRWVFTDTKLSPEPPVILPRNTPLPKTE